MELSEITSFQEQRSVQVRGDDTSDWDLTHITDEEREICRKRAEATESVWLAISHGISRCVSWRLREEISLGNLVIRIYLV